jgi:hypothetical protein
MCATPHTYYLLISIETSPPPSSGLTLYVALLRERLDSNNNNNNVGTFSALSMSAALGANAIGGVGVGGATVAEPVSSTVAMQELLSHCMIVNTAGVHCLCVFFTFDIKATTCKNNATSYYVHAQSTAWTPFHHWKIALKRCVQC